MLFKAHFYEIFSLSILFSCIPSMLIQLFITEYLLVHRSILSCQLDYKSALEKFISQDGENSVLQIDIQ